MGYAVDELVLTLNSTNTYSRTIDTLYLVALFMDSVVHCKRKAEEWRPNPNQLGLYTPLPQQNTLRIPELIFWKWEDEINEKFAGNICTLYFTTCNQDDEIKATKVGG
jgi:hypothetical protein